MAKAPTFQKRSRSSNPIELLIMRDILKQEGEQRKQLQDSIAEQRKADLVEGQKREKAARSVSRSAEAVSSAIGRLATGYSEAFKEGGVGSRGRQIVSDVSLWFGGETGDAFRKTGALPGLKTEIIARMMPILTQQGEKEGSVRLVKSIWEKVSLTLPGKAEGLGTARDQMGTTINNMYGFSKAFFDIGIRAGDIDEMSEPDFQAYLVDLEIAKDRVIESPEETERIKEIQAGALGPIDKLIEQGAQANIVFPPIPGLGGRRPKFTLGQIINLPDGRRAEVTGIDDPDDPDVRLI